MNSFTDYLQSWGYLDISSTDTFIEEYGLNPQDVAERIEQLSEECNLPIHSIDPVAQAYELALQIVREEIEQHTGKDIQSSVDNNNQWIDVEPNYLATSFDGSEEAF